ncbi:hypothetical protein ACFVWG_14750 [Kribbella sp. NPDC058245]|uniref:hypothetical protein n=1 Tax=Kribbella sp. NPDC058245 TaxID=3346399 RepID=UPI0036E6B272
MGATDLYDGVVRAGALQRYIDNADTNLARIRAQMDRVGEEHLADPLAVGRLAAERAFYVLPAVRAWAVWALEQLDQAK